VFCWKRKGGNTHADGGTMKKTILLFLFLFPVFVFADWDANLTHYYTLSGTAADSVGAINLDALGTPHYKFETNTAMTGLNVATHDNTLKFPAALISELATDTAFTLEADIWNPGTGVYFTFGMGGKTLNWISDAYSCGYIFHLGTNVLFGFCGELDYGTSASLASGLHHLQLCWDGSSAYVYYDATLQYTVNSKSVNPFSQITVWTLGEGYYGDTFNSNGILFDFMVSNINRAGVQPTPYISSPTFTPTYTVTQTITPTFTPTYTVTQTITPTITPTFTPTVTPTCGLCVVRNILWSELTDNAEFGKRDKFGMTFDNFYSYIIAGTYLDYPTYNNVWKSHNGIAWTEATSNAGFLARGGITSLYYNNLIWVMAGDFKHDVWYSSTQGATWTKAIDYAAFPGRQGQTGLIFDNKMWVISGAGSQDMLNDVWYSTNGIDWTAATRNAEFVGRKNLASTVFDNKIWIMGGTNGSTIYYNDVWYSSDGISWTEATSNAAFPQSDALNAFSSYGLMYVYSQTTDIFYISVNGIDWDILPYAGTLPPNRRDSNMIFIGNSFILAAGYNGDDLKDVWQGELIEYCLSATPTITPTVTPTITKTATPTATITPVSCLPSGDIHLSTDDLFFELQTNLQYVPALTKRPYLSTQLRCMALNINVVLYFTNTCNLVARVPQKYDYDYNAWITKAAPLGVVFLNYATPTVTPTPT
jgi:hypothetical protein